MNKKEERIRNFEKRFDNLESESTNGKILLHKNVENCPSEIGFDVIIEVYPDPDLYIESTVEYMRFFSGEDFAVNASTRISNKFLDVIEIQSEEYDQLEVQYVSMEALYTYGFYDDEYEIIFED